jgi:hypothetical protein
MSGTPLRCPDQHTRFTIYLSIGLSLWDGNKLCLPAHHTAASSYVSSSSRRLPYDTILGRALWGHFGDSNGHASDASDDGWKYNLGESKVEYLLLVVAHTPS